MIRDTSRVLGLSPHSTAAAGGAPPLAPPNTCRLYHELDTQQLLVSINASPWFSLAGVAVNGWTDDGATVRLTTAADSVAIGQAAAVASSKVTIVGSTANPQLRLQADDTPSWIQLARTAATEPSVGWFVTGGDFFGTWNQTLFIGHNPTVAGPDANKPQLGLAAELRFKASAPANPKAEIYFVWQHDDGTQIRPVGSTIEYASKLVLNNLSGETYFLDEAAVPTQLARVTRTGAIVSDGGASKGFYAAGNNRLFLAADNTVAINQQVLETLNNTELRIGSASSWTRCTVTPELDAAGAFRLSGDISPASLGAGGTTNDYAPAGLATASTIRQDAAGAHTLNGLTGGSDGRRVQLFNISAANTITLAHENAGSTAANRFTLPGAANVAIGPLESVTLWYDITSSRWRVIR